ncbi:MAG: sugar transporter, ATP-binding protein component [Nocardioides sp.]|uniref:sugar ABC transporter ATP-binding protein n=1 Tax=Nocardioides sp. TaxID=35761 RepID=UPI002610E98B|nr:sugar ABC transporter ATP-binding protein [Nocardioides sp.]MCW2833527.1 sugar transporter, ATP-binding protein component [Nocardioides sp.]
MSEFTHEAGAHSTSAAPSTPEAGWVVRAANVSMVFGATSALREVDLVLRPSRVHALLGKNGCGKSTLVKVLAGYHVPSAGEVQWADTSADAGQQIAFVHQDLGLVPTLTVAENLGLVTGFTTRAGAIDWRAERRRATEALAELSVDCKPSQAVGELGPVEQTLVAVARALAILPSTGGVLVLDEPTARLPAEAARRLVSQLTKLRRRGTAILFISHRLEEVEELADEVTVLRDGVVVHHGEADELDHDSLTSLVVGEAAAAAVERTAALGSTDVCVDVRGLTGQKVRRVDLQIRRGEVLGVAGLVGSGRSELGRLLFGLQDVREGTIEVDGVDVTRSRARANVGRGFGYVPQDRKDGLFLELSVADNAVIADLRSLRVGYGVSRALERSAAREVVASHLVKSDGIDASMSTLSGGNQQKVAIGKWMRRDLRFLILDEPTQGIDVGARAEILSQIRAAARLRGLAVLVMDSDVEILVEHCDRVVVMSRGHVVNELAGQQLTTDNVNRAVYGTGRMQAS